MATEKKTLVNEQITARQVRLISAGGGQVGVMSLARAMQKAAEADLDLVEISPNAEPPVCRLMDYGKFLYNASKKKHSARKKQKQVGLKEVKFRPGTDDHDYEIKLRKLRGFLADGNKTKVTLRFRGREMAHPELGTEMLERVRADLAEASTVEQEAKQEGRQMVMVLAPRKTAPQTNKQKP